MEVVALADVCEVIAGQSPPSSTYNNTKDGMPFFQGKADFGELYPITRMWCSEPRKISFPNDILISVRAPVGPTNINSVKACIGRGLSAIRCSGRIQQKFLLHFLRFNEHKIADKGTGSTFKAITQKELKSLQIPLPPLAEQQKISAILDAADTLRQKDQQLIDHYTTLSQSLFLEMFGDPVTNPKGWKTLVLKDMIEFLTSGSRGWAKYYSEVGNLFLRIQNIGKNRLLLNDVTLVTPPVNAEAKRTKVEAGDILLSITADLGRTAVIPIDFPQAYINQHLAIIRLKAKYLPYYVSEYISSVGGERQFMQLDKGGVKAGLNFSDIKSLNIPNPPITLQNQFAERIQQIEAQKQQAQASLKHSEALFNSLLQRAFSGELSSP